MPSVRKAIREAVDSAVNKSVVKPSGINRRSRPAVWLEVYEGLGADRRFRPWQVVWVTLSRDLGIPSIEEWYSDGR